MLGSNTLFLNYQIIKKINPLLHFLLKTCFHSSYLNNHNKKFSINNKICVLQFQVKCTYPYSIPLRKETSQTLYKSRLDLKQTYIPSVISQFNGKKMFFIKLDSNIFYKRGQFFVTLSCCSYSAVYNKVIYLSRYNGQ